MGEAFRRVCFRLQLDAPDRTGTRMRVHSVPTLRGT